MSSREHSRDFATPSEIKEIFEHLNDMWLIFKGKNIDSLNGDTLEIAYHLKKCYLLRDAYNRRMDKEYNQWERTRPKSQSEIESERYNYPG